MRIVIAGAHGQIALQLHPLLLERGHEVRGLVRKSRQAEHLTALGVTPVLCDLEQETDLSAAVGKADAVLFAAGAGPGSGAARKWTMDRDGAIKLIDAAKQNGVGRYLMISAMNPHKPRGSEVFQVYLEAKAEADQALIDSGLNYTIVRPGRLTNDPPRGLVALAPKLPRREIPRGDVAAVLARLIDHPASIGKVLDLTSGQQPVDDAVRAALGQPD